MPPRHFFQSALQRSERGVIGNYGHGTQKLKQFWSLSFSLLFPLHRLKGGRCHPASVTLSVAPHLLPFWKQLLWAFQAAGIGPSTTRIWGVGCGGGYSSAENSPTLCTGGTVAVLRAVPLTAAEGMILVHLAHVSARSYLQQLPPSVLEPLGAVQSPVPCQLRLGSVGQ